MNNPSLRVERTKFLSHPTTSLFERALSLEEKIKRVTLNQLELVTVWHIHPRKGEEKAGTSKQFYAHKKEW